MGRIIEKPMNLTPEQRKQRIETGVKLAGALGIGLLAAPVIFVAIKGLIGLMIAAAVGIGAIQLTPLVAKQGEYQFDIRFNETPSNATEAAVFSNTQKPVLDEAAFFAVDATIQSLTGTMKYRDTKAKDIVSASSVAVDLTGNKLSKQQVMNAFKLVMISSIVPINAE